MLRYLTKQHIYEYLYKLMLVNQFDYDFMLTQTTIIKIWFDLLYFFISTADDLKNDISIVLIFLLNYIDYMHLVLLGMFKKLGELYLPVIRTSIENLHIYINIFLSLNKHFC